MATIDADPIDMTQPGYEPIPVGDTPPGFQSISDQRLIAYRLRSDPLFFKWQRGEATQQEWLDEVEAIRDKYPNE